MKKSNLSLILTIVLVICVLGMVGGGIYIAVHSLAGKSNGFVTSLDCTPYKNQTKDKFVDLSRNYHGFQNTQSLTNQIKTSSPIGSTYDILGNQNITSITSDDIDFINACENNMKYTADPNVIADFNALKTTNPGFESIAQIAPQMQTIVDRDFVATLQQANEDGQIVAFYNMLINLFSEKVAESLVFNIDIDQNAPADQAVAYTQFGFFGSTPLQCITLGPDTFDPNLVIDQYDAGFWSNSDPIETLVHETGHALAMYAWLAPSTMRSDLNNFNNQNVLNELEQIEGGACSGDWSQYRNPSVIGYPPQDGVDVQGLYVDPTTGRDSSAVEQQLVDYIAYKVGINIYDKSIDQDEMRKTKLLAAWSYIQSGYGRFGVEKNAADGVYVGGTGELFAEAFSQWFLTPDDKKALNWQVLNDFFTGYSKVEDAKDGAYGVKDLNSQFDVTA